MNLITHGDAPSLVKCIPPRSVNLIFTDPIYQDVSAYQWLERVSRDLLTADGNTLAFVNAWHAPNVVRALEQPPHPLLSAVQQTGGKLSGRTIAKTYHLIWLGCGRPIDGQYVPDGYIANTWSAPHLHNHKWTKNPRYLAVMLSAFTKPGDLVLDPFCGGGSILAACKMLGRRYLGFDIDPDAVKRARTLVEAQQPMTFLPGEKAPLWSAERAS